MDIENCGKNGSLYLVAEVSGHIIGDLALAKDGWNLTGHVAYLGMNIQKNYRNQGIGARMLHQAIEWARASAAIKKDRA